MVQGRGREHAAHTDKASVEPASLLEQSILSPLEQVFEVGDDLVEAHVLVACRRLGRKPGELLRAPAVEVVGTCRAVFLGGFSASVGRFLGVGDKRSGVSPHRIRAVHDGQWILEELITEFDLS